MKLYLTILLAPLLLSAVLANAQGTFIYDQQSSDENNIQPGGVSINPIANPAQSFTPSLSAVQFIRLYIEDTSVQDPLGVSLVVNVRSNAFNGTIIGSSDLVVIPNGFGGTVNFVFGNSVSVIPGSTYYFDITRLAGNDSFDSNISFYNYNGGEFYHAGGPDTQGLDMWFREGIIVPEPSLLAFLVGGGISLILMRRKPTVR